MREILFRGRQADGQWAFGSLLKVTYDGNTYNLIFADNFLFVSGKGTEMEPSAVDPSTIGQFAGLTDKNGKKIFEGDIIKTDNGKQSAVLVVKYGEYYPKMFYEMLDMFCPGKKHLEAVGLYAVSVDKNEEMILFQGPCVEVIGNIHDNPELIKED